VKYRKSLFDKKVKQIVNEAMIGFKERYDLEIQTVGYDQNHLHILCRFLPKYSGGDVVRLIKSITAKKVFQQVPEIKRELWGGEFWTDGYYISTVSGRGDKAVIEKYIQNQGREKELKQLELFEF
jgi:putative transposase